MTTYVLIPGATGQAWYWHRVTPLLAERGYEALPVELPGADDSAGLVEYAETVIAAIGDRPAGDLVLVGQSMGGFTAGLVAAELPVREVVLVNAMTPKPGETPGEWWDATGQGAAAREMAVREGRDPDAPFDPWVDFFHDVPERIVEEAKAGPPPVQSDTPFEKPWPLAAWPDVPTRFLQGRDDRLFPVEFQRKLVADRLGVEIEELPGGHLVALSRPVELVDLLTAARG
ncbi:alpha/beta fold hydrolase [Actinomycetes bacterium KLBMP 9759]